jgi:hypothetical protein
MGHRDDEGDEEEDGEKSETGREAARKILGLVMALVVDRPHRCDHPGNPVTFSVSDMYNSRCAVIQRDSHTRCTLLSRWTDETNK